MNPRVEIDLDKIRNNAEYLIAKCHEEGIKVAGVTKVVCGLGPVVDELIVAGVDQIADSRLRNLASMDVDIPKLLLRLPMISEVEKVVQIADLSLNSELATIRALEEACQQYDKNHGVILMVDLGDLREGIYKEEEILGLTKEIKAFPHITLAGIGVNLTCYGGVIPTTKNLGELSTLKEKIEAIYGEELPYVSGGNSSSLSLLFEQELPSDINHLRLGEAIYFGRETAYGNPLSSTYQDAIRLVAELIEVKEKPSYPIGDIGMNAFGEKPSFEDKGTRKRGILAVGKQDVQFQHLIPEMSGIEIIGSSSDHLLIDLTDCKVDYKVGDKIGFRVTYGGLLSLCTSSYVDKVFVHSLSSFKEGMMEGCV